MALSQAFVKAFEDLAKGDSSTLESYNDSPLMTGEQILQNTVELNQKEKQEEEDNSIEGQLKKEKEEKKESYDRPMEGLDWIFGKAGQVAQGIQDLAGMDAAIAHVQQEGLNPDNLGRLAGSFAASIPLGLISAPADIASRGYEAITGKPVYESADDMMANNDLNEVQRMGSAGDALMNAAGILTGGVGRGLTGVGKVANAVARGEKALEGASGLAKAFKAGEDVYDAGKKGLAGFAREVGLNTAEGAAGGYALAYRGDQDTYADGKEGPSQDEITSSVLQGAAMGAAGGMIGEGVERVTKFMAPEVANQDKQLNSANKEKEVLASNAFSETSLTDTSKNVEVPDGVEHVGELDAISKLRNEETAKGERDQEVMSTVLQPNSDLAGNETILSSGSLMNRMLREDEAKNREAAQDIADAFFVSDQADNLYKAAQNNDLHTFHKTLEAGMENNKDKDVIVYGQKNPAASEKAASEWRVKGLEETRDPKMEVAQELAGSENFDFDSDLSQLSVKKSHIENAESPFKRMITADGTKSMFEYNKLGMGVDSFLKGNDLDVDRVRNTYSKTLDNLKLNDRNEDGLTFWDYHKKNGITKDKLIDDMTKSYQATDNTDVNISRSIQNVYDLVEQWNGKNKANSAVTDVFRGMRQGTSPLTSQVKGAVANHAELTKNVHRNIQESRPELIQKGSVYSPKRSNVSNTYRSYDPMLRTEKDVNDVFREAAPNKYSFKGVEYFAGPNRKPAEIVGDIKDVLGVIFNENQNGEHFSDQVTNWKANTIVNLTIAKLNENGNGTTRFDPETNSIVLDRNIEWSTFIDTMIESANEVKDTLRVSLNELVKGNENNKVEIPFYEEFKIAQTYGGTSIKEKAVSLSDVLLNLDTQLILEADNGRTTFIELKKLVKQDPVYARDLNDTPGTANLGSIVEGLIIGERKKYANATRKYDETIYNYSKQFADGMKLEQFMTDGKLDPRKLTPEAIMDLKTVMDGSFFIENGKTFHANGVHDIVECICHKWLQPFFKALAQKDINLAHQKHKEADLAFLVNQYYGDGSEVNCIKNMIDLKEALINKEYAKAESIINDTLTYLNKVVYACERAGGNDFHNAIYSKFNTALYGLFDAETGKLNTDIDINSNLSKFTDLITTFEDLIDVSDTSKSFDTKMSQFLDRMDINKTLPEYSKVTKESLMYGMMAKPGESLSDVGLNRKIVASRQFVKKEMTFQTAKKEVYTNQIKEIDKSLESTYGLTNDIDKYEAAVSRLRTNATHIKPDTIIQTVLDSIMPNTEGAEKAGNVKAVIRQEQMMTSVLNASYKARSYLSQYSTSRTATITEADLCSNRYVLANLLTDPSYKVKLLDNNGTSRLIDQQEMYYRLGGINLNGKEPTWSQFKELLVKEPKLCELLVDKEMGNGHPKQNDSVVCRTTNDNVVRAIGQEYVNKNNGSYQKTARAFEEYERRLSNSPKYWEMFALYIKNADQKDFTYDQANALLKQAKKNVDITMKQLIMRSIIDKQNAKLSKKTRVASKSLVEEYKQEIFRQGYKSFENDLIDMVLYENNNIDLKESSDAIMSRSLANMSSDLFQETMKTGLSKLAGVSYKPNKAVKDSLKNSKDNLEKALLDSFRNEMNKFMLLLDWNSYANAKLKTTSVSSLFDGIGKILDDVDNWDISDAEKIKIKKFYADDNGDFTTFMYKKFRNTSMLDVFPKIDSETVRAGLSSNNIEEFINKYINTKLKDKTVYSFNISRTIDGEYNLGGILDTELLKGLEDNFNIAKNADPANRETAITTIVDLLNERLLSQRLSQQAGFTRRNDISLDVQKKAENTFDSLIQNIDDIYDDVMKDNGKLEKDYFLDLNNMSNKGAEIPNSFIEEMFQMRLDEYPKDSINIFSKITASDMKFIGDTVNAAAIPTTVGVYGNAPTYAVAFGSLRLLGPQQTKRLELNPKSKTYVEDTIGQLCSEAFLSRGETSRWNQNQTDLIQFTDVDKVMRGDYSCFDSYFVDTSKQIKPTDFVKKVLKINPDSNEWITLDEATLQLLCKEIIKNPYQLRPDSLIVSTGFGNIPSNTLSIVSYLMEPRILKTRKKEVPKNASILDEASYYSGIEDIYITGDKVKNALRNVSDNQALASYLLTERNKFAERYKENIIKTIRNSEIDSDSMPGMVNIKDKEFFSYAPGIFDILIPWVELKVNGREVKFSCKQLENAMNGERPLIDPYTKKEIDLNAIEDIKCTVQDPETLSNIMLQNARRAEKDNPNITSHEYELACAKAYEEPPAWTGETRSLKTIFNENMSYDLNGKGSTLDYLKINRNVRELIQKKGDYLSSRPKGFLSKIGIKSSKMKTFSPNTNKEIDSLMRGLTNQLVAEVKNNGLNDVEFSNHVQVVNGVWSDKDSKSGRAINKITKDFSSESFDFGLLKDQVKNLHHGSLNPTENVSYKRAAVIIDYIADNKTKDFWLQAINNVRETKSTMIINENNLTQMNKAVGRDITIKADGVLFDPFNLGNNDKYYIIYPESFHDYSSGKFGVGTHSFYKTDAKPDLIAIADSMTAPFGTPMADAGVLVTKYGQKGRAFVFRDQVEFKLPQDALGGKLLHDQEKQAKWMQLNDKSAKVDLDLTMYKDKNISPNYLRKQTEIFLNSSKFVNDNGIEKADFIKPNSVVGVYSYRGIDGHEKLIPILFDAASSRVDHAEIQLEPSVSSGGKIIMQVDSKKNFTAAKTTFASETWVQSPMFKSISASHSQKGMGTGVLFDAMAANGDRVSLMWDGPTADSRMAKGSSLEQTGKVGSAILGLAHSDTKKNPELNFSLTDMITSWSNTLAKESPEYKWMRENQLRLLSGAEEGNLLKFKERDVWLDFVNKGYLDQVLNNYKQKDNYNHLKRNQLNELFRNNVKRMIASDVNPLWLMDKQKLQNLLISTPGEIHAFSNFFETDNDFYKIYNFLCVGGDKAIHHEGKYVSNLDTAPVINGDRMKFTFIDEDGNIETHFLRFAYERTNEDSPLSYKSQTGPDASIDSNQRVSSYLSTGKGDFKDIVNTIDRKKTSLEKGYPSDLYVNIPKTESIKNIGQAHLDNNMTKIGFHMSRYDLSRDKDSGWIKFLRNQNKHEQYGYLKIYDFKEKDKTYTYKDSKIQFALDQFLDLLGYEHTNKNYRMATGIIEKVAGYTITTEEHPMPYNLFLNATREAMDSIEEGKIPGAIDKDSTRWNPPSTNTERFSLPITSDRHIEWLANSKAISQTADEIKTMIDNNLLDINEVISTESVYNKAQHRELCMGMDRAFMQMGRDIDTLRFNNDMRYRDILDNGLAARKGMSGIGGDQDAFIKEMKNYGDRIELFQQVQRNKDHKVIKDELAENGSYTVKRNNENKTVSNFMRTCTTLSRALGLLDVGIFAQNAIDKAVGYTSCRLLLSGGARGVGPFKSAKKAIDIPDPLIKKIASDPEVIAFFDAWHLASFKGEEMQFKNLMKNTNLKPSEYINKYKKEASKLNLAYNQIARIGTAENMWVSRRNENAIRLWLKTAAEDGYNKFLDQSIIRETKEGPLEMNRLQAFMEGQPPHVAISEMFLGGETIPSDVVGAKAWNITLKGDLAQNNVVTWFIEHAIAKSSLADFLMCTVGNKYFRASTNTMGRTLNWVAPMSTFNYLAAKLFQNNKFIEAMGKHGPLKEWGGIPDAFKQEMEIVKGYNQLREAILVDAMHMGAGALATMLAGAAFLQPPDNEDKAVNYQEWTVCGMRIGQAWWLDDILGVAAPLACFWKSAEMGNPNFNILINGFNHHLSNNPFMKIGDCVSSVLNVDHSIDEAEAVASMYDNAPQGAPTDGVAYVLGSLPGVTMSYVSQFITPAFVRDLDKSMKQYEVSYNRVFETSPSGVLTEAGQNGKTVKTSFADAQIRKVTRNNPILGTIMNILPTGSTTSYVGSDMPRQVFYEPAQLAFMKKYSILDSNGNEKSNEEQQAIAAQIIQMLASSNNMKELYKQGFCLDYETKTFVSEVMHDMYQLTKDDFNSKKASGALDYYVLGDGDYTKGQRIYNQYYNAYQQQLQYWQNIYKEKLYSTELNQGIQKYNRYNTTYLQDANGQWYATGFKEGYGGMLAPLVYAPPESGKEFDYASISALNGSPMVDLQGNAMRGMVAISDDAKTPSIESWAKESNNGYSNSYGTKYSGGSYGRSYSGGGRSGGGGSSRVSIKSYSPNLNIGSPATPRSSNLKNAQYDYLKPNYTTQGSRKAYKRNS